MTRERGRTWLGTWLNSIDVTLFLTVVGLLSVGLVAVYSATVQWAAYTMQNPAYWFQRQLMWAVLALGVMILVSFIPYEQWRAWALPMLIVTLLLLMAVLVMGQQVFGSRRFLFGKSVQPSELAKFSLVVYAATWLASRVDRLDDMSYGLIPFSVIVGVVAGLVAIQPDLSTAILLGTVGVVLFFVAGADTRQVIWVTLMGLLTMGLLIGVSGHAQERLRQLAEVWRGEDMAEWSQLQGVIYVLQQGGLLGRGPGALNIRVSAIHNDFILAAIGHAFGLLGILGVLALTLLLLWRGFVIAAYAPDIFAHFLALGMTTWLVGQALINMGATVALLPPTGINFPFVSYGGSSLVVSGAAAGVLLHLSQYVPTKRRHHAAGDVRRGDRGTRVPSFERAGSRASVGHNP